VYIPSHLISNGGSVTWDALERGGGSGACGRGGRAPRTRGALGNRPGLLRGSAFNGWTGVGEGWGNLPGSASLLAPAAGSTVPRTKKSPRRDAERRCRVPLILGNPGIKPRPLPRCAFRRSASLFSLRGRFTEPTIHAKQFAGGDDACVATRSNPLTVGSANSTLRQTRKNAAAGRKP
jgi:hypothetical protein